jgi:hypothetical protein
MTRPPKFQADSDGRPLPPADLYVVVSPPGDDWIHLTSDPVANVADETRAGAKVYRARVEWEQITS